MPDKQLDLDSFAVLLSVLERYEIIDVEGHVVEDEPDVDKDTGEILQDKELEPVGTATAEDDAPPF